MPIQDLTRPIEPGMPAYPGDPPVECTAYADVERDGFAATALSLTTHTGTHVDAPAHTEPDGDTIDAVPPEALRFDAVRLDVSGVSARAPIDRERLREAIDAGDAGAASDADMLVLDTGWAAHWGDERYHDHPYLAADAAAWVADRGHHVALDAPSVDPTPTERAGPDEPEGLPAHHALLGEGLLVVENLRALGGLPASFRLVASPLPVVGGDGAPARVTAEW